MIPQTHIKHCFTKEHLTKVKSASIITVKVSQSNQLFFNRHHFMAFFTAWISLEAGGLFLNSYLNKVHVLLILSFTDHWCKSLYVLTEHHSWISNCVHVFSANIVEAAANIPVVTALFSYGACYVCWPVFSQISKKFPQWWLLLEKQEIPVICCFGCLPLSLWPHFCDRDMPWKFFKKMTSWGWWSMLSVCIDDIGSLITELIYQFKAMDCYTPFYCQISHFGCQSWSAVILLFWLVNIERSFLN